MPVAVVLFCVARVLDLSLFVQANWFWLLLAVVLLAASFALFRQTRRGRFLLSRVQLKIPVTGPIAHNIVLARFSHNFATMYNAGMTINAIFEILARDVLGNRYLEACLQQAFREVQRGQTIAKGLELAGGFPPLLLGAVKNGELTGTLDEAFKRLGSYYDNEVKRSVQAFLNALEPMTIILLGGTFGVIILSILLPLYDVISQFK